MAYVALAVAVGSGGSYALAATTSNGTIAVCVDKGSGVMHLAKHPRCGHDQSRIGLSSALDRPTVSAWAAPSNGGVDEWFGSFRSTHAGAGVYDVTVTAASCRMRSTTRRWSASTTASRRAAGAPAPSRWRGRRLPARGSRRFTIHTGVVVAGAFQPRDEPFNFTDSCGLGRGRSRRCARDRETSAVSMLRSLICRRVVWSPASADGRGATADNRS